MQGLCSRILLSVVDTLPPPPLGGVEGLGGSQSILILVITDPLPAAPGVWGPFWVLGLLASGPRRIKIEDAKEEWGISLQAADRDVASSSAGLL